MALGVQTKRLFMFILFLSSDDHYWYLSHNKSSKKTMCHTNNFRPPDYLISILYSDLVEDIKNQSSLGNYVIGTNNIEIVPALFGVNVTTHTILVTRNEYTKKLLQYI